MNTYNIRKRIIRDLSIPPKHICCYHGKQITDDMILYDLTDKEIFDLWDTIIKCQFNKGVGLKMQNFTKSDLRDRMVVETRAHLFYIVIGSYLIGVSDSINLDSYNKYLQNFHYYEKDIAKVYAPVYRLDGFVQQPIDSHITATNSIMTLLWERASIKEVTMSEVEEKFGCKVKIINDKNT